MLRFSESSPGVHTASWESDTNGVFHTVVVIESLGAFGLFIDGEVIKRDMADFATAEQCAYSFLRAKRPLPVVRIASVLLACAVLGGTAVAAKNLIDGTSGESVSIERSEEVTTTSKIAVSSSFERHSGESLSMRQQPRLIDSHHRTHDWMGASRPPVSSGRVSDQVTIIVPPKPRRVYSADYPSLFAEEAKQLHEVRAITANASALTTRTAFNRRNTQNEAIKLPVRRPAGQVANVEGWHDAAVGSLNNMHIPLPTLATAHRRSAATSKDADETGPKAHRSHSRERRRARNRYSRRSSGGNGRSAGVRHRHGRRYAQNYRVRRCTFGVGCKWVYIRRR